MMKEAKGKEPPFNFNSCMNLDGQPSISARTTLPSCFSALHRNRHSTQERRQNSSVYENLVELLFSTKKYVALIDLSEEFMDLKGPKEVLDFQPFMLEWAVKATSRKGTRTRP